jgi:hypothetical protein
MSKIVRIFVFSLLKQVNRLLRLIAIETREWKWTRLIVPESRNRELELILVILNHVGQGQSMFFYINC